MLVYLAFQTWLDLLLVKQLNQCKIGRLSAKLRDKPKGLSLHSVSTRDYVMISGGAMTARPGGIEVVRDPGQTSRMQTRRFPLQAIAFAIIL